MEILLGIGFFIGFIMTIFVVGYLIAKWLIVIFEFIDSIFDGKDNKW